MELDFLNAAVNTQKAIQCCKSFILRWSITLQSHYMGTDINLMALEWLRSKIALMYGFGEQFSRDKPYAYTLTSLQKVCVIWKGLLKFRGSRCSILLHFGHWVARMEKMIVDLLYSYDVSRTDYDFFFFRRTASNWINWIHDDTVAATSCSNTCTVYSLPTSTQFRSPNPNLNPKILINNIKKNITW